MTTQRKVTSKLLDAVTVLFEDNHVLLEERLYAVVHGKAYLLGLAVLGKDTRAGAVLARVLAIGDIDEVVIVATIPTQRRVSKPCKDAVDRIMAASRLIDLALLGIVELSGGNTVQILDEMEYVEPSA